MPQKRSTEPVPDTSLHVPAWLVLAGVASVVVISLIEMIEFHASPSHPDSTEILKHGLLTLIREIGIGFVVATIVAVLFHVQEFSTFFESLARRVMLKFEFIENLDEPTLRSLRRRSAEAHVQKFVAPGHKEYDGAAVVRALTAVETLLPSQSKGSGIYRRNYCEKLVINLVNARQVEELLDLSVGSVLPGDYLDVTQTVSYEFVLPSPNEDTSVPLPFVVSIMPVKTTPGANHLDQKKLRERQVRLWDEHDKEVRLTSTPPVKDGNPEVTYEATHSELRFDGLVRKVSYRMKSIRLQMTEPYVFFQVAKPTLGIEIDVTFNNFGEDIVPRLLVSNLAEEGTEKPRIKIKKNSVDMTSEHWFLEDHGYFLWW